MILVTYNREDDELYFFPDRPEVPDERSSVRRVRERFAEALGEINVDGCWQFVGEEVVVGARAWLGRNREMPEERSNAGTENQNSM